MDLALCARARAEQDAEIEELFVDANESGVFGAFFSALILLLKG